MACGRSGHLRICWIALVLGGVVLSVVAGLATGAGAIAGVALGTAIVGVFFSLSAVVIARMGARSPKLVVPAALGTYILKIVALGVVLTVLPRDGFFDTRWMAGAVGLGSSPGWVHTCDTSGPPRSTTSTRADRTPPTAGRMIFDNT